MTHNLKLSDMYLTYKCIITYLYYKYLIKQ